MDPDELPDHFINFIAGISTDDYDKLELGLETKNAREQYGLAYIEVDPTPVRVPRNLKEGDVEERVEDGWFIFACAKTDSGFDYLVFKPTEAATKRIGLKDLAPHNQELAFPKPLFDNTSVLIKEMRSKAARILDDHVAKFVAAFQGEHPELSMEIVTAFRKLPDVSALTVSSTNDPDALGDRVREFALASENEDLINRAIELIETTHLRELFDHYKIVGLAIRSDEHWENFWVSFFTLLIRNSATTEAGTQ